MHDTSFQHIAGTLLGAAILVGLGIARHLDSDHAKRQTVIEDPDNLGYAMAIPDHIPQWMMA